MALYASASPFLSLLANGITVGAILGCGAYGWRQGLFRTTVLAFGVLASCVVAIAFSEGAASWLGSLEVSGTHANWVAYFAVFGAMLFGSWAIIENYLHREIWFSDGLVSRSVAMAIGGLAGLLLAGGLLVGWTIVPLPSALQLEPSGLKLDAGEFALRVFAKCIERDLNARAGLLGGKSPDDLSMVCSSEPFVDSNGNCVRDEDERYVDWDKNGEFTPKLGCRKSAAGTAGTETELIGLLDHYRLASWAAPRFLHAPRLLSATEVKVVSEKATADVLYEASAEDVDPCDIVRFSAEPGEDFKGFLTVDEATGLVTIVPGDSRRQSERYEFTLIVSDQAGLQDARRVVVHSHVKDGDRAESDQ